MQRKLLVLLLCVLPLGCVTTSADSARAIPTWRAGDYGNDLTEFPFQSEYVRSDEVRDAPRRIIFEVTGALIRKERELIPVGSELICGVSAVAPTRFKVHAVKFPGKDTLFPANGVVVWPPEAGEPNNSFISVLSLDVKKEE